jgi:hypothetical protein
MRLIRIEKEVEMYATNLANKANCMSTNAKKWKHAVSTARAIVKYQVMHHAVNFVDKLFPSDLFFTDHLHLRSHGL